MKRFFSYFIVLILILSFATACSDTKDDSIVSADVDESWKTLIVSVDDVVEDIPHVTEETRIWYEFEGKVYDCKEIDGVKTYYMYDKINDFPYCFVVPDETNLPIEEFSIGDYVRIFVFDEPGLYEVDEENIQTVHPSMILLYDEPTEVFYAEIISVSDSGMHVRGIEINGRRYREKEYILSIENKTNLIQHGIQIELIEFKPGDVVAVYFCGEIMESSPARLPDVRMVEKLND